jgi:serine protease Do
VNQSLADSFGLKRPAGALVSSVSNNSPAAKAGVEPGDIIVRYNDREIVSSNELPLLVSSAAPGTTAKLEVVRNGETKHLNVTIGEMKGGKVAAAAPAEESHGRLGIAARQLTPEEQKQAGVKGGVLVENASGAAAEAGIQSGDVILSFNGTPVKTVDELRSLVAKAGKKVALLVMREDAKIFVPVDLG